MTILVSVLGPRDGFLIRNQWSMRSDSERPPEGGLWVVKGRLCHVRRLKDINMCESVCVRTM